MNLDVIKQTAWLGEEYITGPIRGIVLSFHGLGHGGLKGGPSTEELEWARAGGLVVFPYYGPWSWMNRQARAFVDDLVDSLYAAYRLPNSAPLICTGGSMGGLSSLLYTRYARRPVAACYVNCPVCDLKFHFTERPDVAPTVRSAFMGYGDDLESLLAEHSPLSQVPNLPDIPYLIIHGGRDTAVSKANHSDPMVAAMRRRKMSVQYIEVPLMGHCGPLPLEVMGRTVEFVGDALHKSELPHEWWARRAGGIMAAGRSRDHGTKEVHTRVQAVCGEAGQGAGLQHRGGRQEPGGG